VTINRALDGVAGVAIFLTGRPLSDRNKATLRRLVSIRILAGSVNQCSVSPA
jgi:hypothetical protein